MAARRQPIDPEFSKTLFAERHCSTAEELLKNLLPHTSSMLYNRWEHRWLFRGQMDASWGLTPRAMRTDELSQFSASRLDTSTARKSMELEESLVVTFSSLLDEYGFEVPGDRPELRDRHGRSVQPSREGTRFPQVQLRWFYAIAQHYGIPTRLLDWSGSALVACYFAAIDATRANPEARPNGKRMSVWALSQDYVDALSKSGAPRVTLVTAPTVSNPNLLAQRSVFTLVEFLKPRPKSKGGCWPLPDLDTLVRNRRFATPEMPRLIKFTLPHGIETRRLLYFLYRQGVHAASVFPWRGAVVDVMREDGLRSVANPNREPPG